MDSFYKGDEIKVAITLKAEGFDMNTDDFDLEVKSASTSIVGHKGDEPSSASDIVIYSETTEESGESATVWYAIIDTAGLATGTMRLIATAHINDEKANDGDRKSIAVATIGKLVEP